MARDYELRWTFSNVSSATNISAVSQSITASPFRGGLVTLTTTANQWAVGYSDALNVTQWRNQTGDLTNLTSGTAASAIPGDPILPGSTAVSEYFLRATVAPIGFVGPDSCNFIVQGGLDTGGGAAPSQTSSALWSQVSGIQVCGATASGVTVNGSVATPASFTMVSGAVPPTGSIVMFTSVGGAGAGVATRTPYVVQQTSTTTFTLVTTLGGTTQVAIAASAMTNGTLLVGQNATALTPISLDDASDRIAFAETVQVGDTIIFGANGSITGLGTAGTLYYVTSVNSLGATLATSSGGATVAIGGSVTSAFAGRVNFYALNAIFPSAGSGTTITTAVPHGLEPGQFIVPLSTANGLTTNVGYYVLTTPTATTFTVSATINGSAVNITGTPSTLFVGRKPKIVNTPINPSVRPWLRMAVQQLNSSAVNDGYVAIYNAELSVGKDSAAVS